MNKGVPLEKVLYPLSYTTLTDRNGIRTHVTRFTDDNRGNFGSHQKGYIRSRDAVGVLRRATVTLIPHS